MSPRFGRNGHYAINAPACHQGTGHPDSPLSGPVHAQPSCGVFITDRNASDTAKIDDCWIKGSTGRAAHSPGSAASTRPAPVSASTSNVWVAGSQKPDRFPVRRIGVPPSAGSGVGFGAGVGVGPVESPGSPAAVDTPVAFGVVVTVDPTPSTSLTGQPKADAADAGSEMPRGRVSSVRSRAPAAVRVSSRLVEASGSRSTSIPITPSWRWIVLAAAASRG